MINSTFLLDFDLICMELWVGLWISSSLDIKVVSFVWIFKSSSFFDNDPIEIGCLVRNDLLGLKGDLNLDFSKN